MNAMVQTRDAQNESMTLLFIHTRVNKGQQ